MEGFSLALKQGYHIKSSVNLRLVPVFIPDCRTYTVEYSLHPDGEFVGYREEDGRIGLRSRLDPRIRVPVCWLPEAFVGKALNRFILRVDRKQVRFRAGVISRRRAS